MVIDPQVAGIAGDMFLCALVDMGADKEAISRGIRKAVSISDDAAINDIEFSKVTRHGMQATGLHLDIRESVDRRAGSQLRSWIEQAAQDLSLSVTAERFAIASIDALISAEARIHGQDPRSVHLHEAAGADTVADIIGSAVALDHLHLYDADIFCCPVAVGGGTFSFSHGVVSNPGTAVLEILKGSGIEIAGGQSDTELTTPTGASMLAGLKPVYSAYYPLLQIDSVGYGAGSRDFADFANVLRVVVGRSTADMGTAGTGAAGMSQNAVHVLETNVDDITGEVLGVAIDRLMDAGALDVTVVSGVTKKGRPTNLVTVMCDPASSGTLLRLLMNETGTLGVRIRRSERMVAMRSPRIAKISLDGQTFDVRYQTNEVTGRFKIESDDIRRISLIIEQTFMNTEALIREQIKGME